jgi:hypothetical protein
VYGVVVELLTRGLVVGVGREVLDEPAQLAKIATATRMPRSLLTAELAPYPTPIQIARSGAGALDQASVRLPSYRDPTG